jgi:hypothetical protein
MSPDMVKCRSVIEKLKFSMQRGANQMHRIFIVLDSVRCGICQLNSDRDNFELGVFREIAIESPLVSLQLRVCVSSVPRG